MKFQPDTLDGVNVITRYEHGRLWIGNGAVRTDHTRSVGVTTHTRSVGVTTHTRSVLVPSRGAVVDWGVGCFAELTAAHFEQIAALSPELVILGTGTRLRFPAPALMRALIERRIGVESMDLGAASRTYTVLATEGRSVLGAFLIEADAAP